MNLYVLRHASAGTRRINPLLDVKRPLDKDGKQHCLYLAHVLRALQTSFDLVISSPLKRSLQTAQMVATETGYEQNVLISNALSPAATFSQFQRMLRECEGHENVLVVGHNPNITATLQWLLDPRVVRALYTTSTKSSRRKISRK
jgi:phosphohistidine phosphatase